MASNNHGLKRIIKAAGYSWKGLCAAWQYECAFRQDVTMLLLLSILTAWLDVTAVERILLIGSVVLVIIVELINSAIEAVVDRIGSEIHPLAGRAKDIASAAVLVAILLSIMTWLMILFTR
ncbi:MAG: Diacylglycerol kinase [Candidatus Erwinia impunctatus]|nr:Diacylglycerol kinase [Culicoides impunctatus]